VLETSSCLEARLYAFQYLTIALNHEESRQVFKTSLANNEFGHKLLVLVKNTPILALCALRLLKGLLGTKTLIISEDLSLGLVSLYY